jgi:pimeloyl-ACP methyl ester carboxylesterase
VKLILLPGLDGTGDLFEPLISELGLGIEPVVLKYPSNEGLGYEQLHQLVRSRLPIGERYFLLGESFSGPVATMIAAEDPPGLGGLILCATFLRNPRPTVSKVGQLAMFLPLNALPASILALPLLNGLSNIYWRQKLKKAVARNMPHVLRGRLRAIFKIDVSSSALKVKVPALYLRATRDRLVPAKSAVQLLGCIPHLHIVSLEGPHMLLQMSPIESANAIRRFIEDSNSS